MIVCSRNQVRKMVKKHNITHIISITDVNKNNLFITPRMVNIPILKLSFEDVLSHDEPNSPTQNDIEKILNWSFNINSIQGILVHCEAGVCRSTAVALAILAQKMCNEQKAIQKLLHIAPWACPNPVVSELADNIMNFKGKLFKESERVADNHILSLM